MDKANNSLHEKAPALTVAIAGNPNAGKTTLFNALSGARQHVGNWPGVTVEKKEGGFEYQGRSIHIVDLPGTYSLTAYSMEEVIARDYILTESPDVVVNIVDASNLERNLYLTVQLLELGAPVIIVLNMVDVAEARNILIDHEQLGVLMGVPVVPMVARTGKGKAELMSAVLDPPPPAQLSVNYGRFHAPQMRAQGRARIHNGKPLSADHICVARCEPEQREDIFALVKVEMPGQFHNA